MMTHVGHVVVPWPLCQGVCSPGNCSRQESLAAMLRRRRRVRLLRLRRRWQKNHRRDAQRRAAAVAALHTPSRPPPCVHPHIAIVDTPQKGRAAVATARFRRGATLFVERPVHAIQARGDEAL